MSEVSEIEATDEVDARIGGAAGKQQYLKYGTKQWITENTQVFLGIPIIPDIGRITRRPALGM
jgi:hypothetical protein